MANTRLKALALAAITVAGLTACASSASVTSTVTAGQPTSSPTRTPAPSAPWSPVTDDSTPLVGVVWAPDQSGWGTVRPSHVYNGGDPTGDVRQIRWTSYGASTARGVGIGWASGESSVASGHRAKAIVVAYDRGSCFGHDAYRHVTWYFPTEGESLSKRGGYDMCPDAHDWLAYTGVSYPGVFDNETRCETSSGGPMADYHLVISSSLDCTGAGSVVARAHVHQPQPDGWRCQEHRGEILCAQAGVDVVSGARPQRGLSAFLATTHIRLVPASGWVQR